MSLFLMAMFGYPLEAIVSVIVENTVINTTTKTVMNTLLPYYLNSSTFNSNNKFESNAALVTWL